MDRLRQASKELTAIGRLLMASDDIQIITDANAYKQVTQIRRIPIARIVDPVTKEKRVVVGNEAIQDMGLAIPGKGYLSDARTEELFSGEVVIEEKVDGHPVVILFGGYTFFCESLSIRHTVSYDGVPLSQNGWPDSTVVYDVIDGEFDNPSSAKGQWLTRSEKSTLCSMVGAPLVPLVWKGLVGIEDVPALADRISSFGSGKAEGVVIKNLQRGVFGKFINLEFQKSISDDALHQDMHPMQRGERNIRQKFVVPDYKE